MKNYELWIRPKGIQEGYYEVGKIGEKMHNTEVIKDFRLQKIFGNRTHILKIEIKELTQESAVKS